MYKSSCLIFLHSTTSTLQRIKIEKERKKVKENFVFKLAREAHFIDGHVQQKNSKTFKFVTSDIIKKENRMKIEGQKIKSPEGTWFYKQSFKE